MRIFADSAAEIDEQLFGIRKMRVVRIVAGINKYFPEKDRTYQALVALGYSVENSDIARSPMTGTS